MAAALEAGANEYVMKPFTKEILVEKLQMVGVHPVRHDMPAVNQAHCSNPENGFACWWWTTRW